MFIALHVDTHNKKQQQKRENQYQDRQDEIIGVSIQKHLCLMCLGESVISCVTDFLSLDILHYKIIIKK